MARIKVTVTATASSLRLEGDETFEYSPKEIVSVGNSMGGYLVAPMSGKPYVWGWWRIGGGMIDRLRSASSAPSVKGVTVNGRPLGGGYDRLLGQIMSGEPERVAVNGRTYLFATSSGSARNGVLHAYRPSTDPIRLALESVGCDMNTGKIVALDEAIGLPEGDWPSTVWSSLYRLASDGQHETTPQFFHGTISQRGCTLDTISALSEGTTYVVALYEGWDGVSCRREITVAVATAANRQAAADAIVRLVREQSRLSGPERKLTSV